MNKRVKVNVGTLGEMGQRFVNAWHRVEHGQKVREREMITGGASATAQVVGHNPMLQAGYGGHRIV